MDKILNYTNENINAKLLGRLPSMIQLPIQEQLDRELGDKSIYNLAMAEFGEKWVDSHFEYMKPDVIFGSGVEGMVGSRYLRENGFKALSGDRLDNPDFTDLKDPKGRFDVIAAIPLTPVVDMRQANGRKVPENIEDLLNEEYENSIMYPDDGAMLKSIFLMYFYKIGGEEAVKRFRKNAIAGVHPSQMIKPGGVKEKPFIMLMAWFFARMKAMQNGMELVWFKNGNLTLPITVSSRDTAEARKITDVLFSKETGEIFRKRGFFPSGSQCVDNELPGKLRFIGWDELYSGSLNDTISDLRRIMGGEA